MLLSVGDTRICCCLWCPGICCCRGRGGGGGYVVVPGVCDVDCGALGYVGGGGLGYVALCGALGYVVVCDMPGMLQPV